MQNMTSQGLSDISNTAASRVKLQEGKLEQPASQRSTMQSVGDFSQGNEENLGVDQAGFSSIQDRKEGSLEHLSNVLKRPYLKRSSYSRKLAKGLKKGKKIQKKAPKGQGKIERFFREKASSFRYGASRYVKKAQRTSKTEDPKKFVLEFSASEMNAGDRRAYLKKTALKKRLAKPIQKKSLIKNSSKYNKLYKQRAGQMRSGARRLLNQSRGIQGGDRSSLDLKPTEWVLSFSSNEFNGGFFKAGKQSDESNPRKWIAEIPASEWNMHSSDAARARAGFLMSRASGFMKRASIQSSSIQKSAGRLYRNAMAGVRSFFGAKKPISK